MRSGSLEAGLSLPDFCARLKAAIAQSYSTWSNKIRTFSQLEKP